MKTKSRLKYISYFNIPSFQKNYSDRTLIYYFWKVLKFIFHEKTFQLINGTFFMDDGYIG
jgi:hypothetical protein